MNFDNLEKSFNEFLDIVTNTLSLEDIEKIKLDFLGKSGKLTKEFKNLNKLSLEEKKTFGNLLNKYKNKAENAINTQINYIKDKILNERLINEKLDISLPVDNSYGSLHLLTREIRRIKQEYQAKGYLVLDGPEVETEFFNFDALNIPKYHPARQPQDTFYLEKFKDKSLRTQTSSVQIRAMQKFGIPLRMISIGKTYRNDQLDATHSPMFHQIEGLVVDYKPVNIGQLQKTLKELIAFVFEVSSNVSLRFRPSFFPFTEPGMEFDCCYKKKENKIELVANGNDWLELGGAGMVHPNVLKNCGIKDNVYGFAFGIGLERLVMLKYGITDIRLFFENDNRWLQYYSSTCNN